MTMLRISVLFALVCTFPAAGCGGSSPSDNNNNHIIGDASFLDGEPTDGRPADGSQVDGTLPDGASPDGGQTDGSLTDAAQDSGFDPCDWDNDGVVDEQCGGPDCEPMNPNIPAATEVDCGNLLDDDCDGFTDMADSECTATNDTCANPIDISGGGSFASSTVGVNADYGTWACGPDLVYEFTLTNPTVTTFTLTVPDPINPPPNFEVDFNVFVGDQCPPDGGVWNSCYCAEPGGGWCDAFPASVAKCFRYGPGTYYVVVQAGDFMNGDGYPFTLDFVLDGPATLPCASAIDISAGGDFDLDATGVSWVNALDECGAAGTNEALYTLTVNTLTNVSLTTYQRDGALYLLDTCSVSATPLSHAPPQFNLPAGTYTVVKELDTYWGSGTSYLNVRFDTPGGACTDATAITGTGSFAGTTAGLTNRILTEPYPTVWGYGPEAVYQVIVAADTRVVADLIPLYTGGILYFQDECMVSATADYNRFNKTHKDKILTPGSYYLIVDGEYAGNEGDYVLNVTFLPP